MSTTTTATAKVSLTEQLSCAEHELGMRRRVYTRWVTERRMAQEKADHEINSMAAIVETVRRAKLIDEAAHEMFPGLHGGDR